MAEQTQQYIETIGRRKQASARVRLHHNGSGKVTVNDRELKEYIPVAHLSENAVAPLKETATEELFDITVKTAGGGLHGQSDAIRLGIARALVEFNPDFRTTLKKLGFLMRDPRVRERKKYGKLGARRSPQWSKR